MPRSKNRRKNKGRGAIITNIEGNRRQNQHNRSIDPITGLNPQQWKQLKPNFIRGLIDKLKNK